jgi:polysaccharide export outer membrane protein
MRFCRLVLAAGIALPCLTWAQQPTLKRNPSSIQQETLLIGPGDQVHVQVFDTPELSATARVDDHGDLPVLMGGMIHVASLSPDQAARAVEQDLMQRKIMNAPRVLVTVEHYATQNVTVFGQVVRPAAYEISTPRSLTDVLSLAGGLTETADRHITIEHHDGRPAETVFVSNNAKKDAGEQTMVSPGDKVTVPKQDLIYVLGDVGRAGGYLMNNSESGMTVLQAVASAGGTAHTAVPNDAKLIRRMNGDGYKSIPLQLSAMQKGKKPDMPMQPNDIIYVPFSYIRNAALGLTGIAASATSAAIYVK